MRRFLTASAAILLSFATLAGCSKSKAVVVYCALDREYAEPILKQFQADTGVEVKAQFDVEMTKTVGLVKAIEEEQNRPRCDVFWNNEILHTLRLQKLGLLAPYASPSASDIPAELKDKDGYWHGFAARARVLIVNTDKLPDPKSWPTSYRSLLDPQWKGKGAIAKPLAGTTQTHVIALYATLGGAAVDKFLADAIANDVIVAPGNAMVARLVRTGEAWFGFTDTDDFHVAQSDGGHVVAVYPDDPKSVDGGIGTLVLPNTVALVKGAPHEEGAKKLIDYLLSADVERRLSSSDSVQIPVRASIPAPPAVKRLDQFPQMKVDWSKVVDAYDQHIHHIEELFNR